MSSKNVFFVGLSICLFICSVALADWLPGPHGEKLVSMGHLWSVALSEDGNTVATLGKEEIVLWDTNTGSVVNRIAVPQSGDFTSPHVLFLPKHNAVMITGSENSVWDVKTGRELRRLESDTMDAWEAIVSKDGQWLLLSVLGHGTQKAHADLWNLTTWQRESRFGILKPYQSTSFSPDGKLIALISGSGKVVLYDRENSQLILEFPYLLRNINKIQFSIDGKWIYVLDEDGSVRQWDVQTGLEQQVWVYTSPENFIETPNGQDLLVMYRTADGSGEMARTFTKTGEIKEIIPGPRVNIPIGFSGDGQSLVTFSPVEGAMLWDLSTGKKIRSYGSYGSSTGTVKFSPNGNKIAAIRTHDIAVYEVQSETHLLFLLPINPDVVALSMSSTGQYLATLNYLNEIVVGNVETGQILLNLKNLQGDDYSVVLSKDGSRVATGRKTETRELGTVWDVASGQKLLSLVLPDVPAKKITRLVRPMHGRQDVRLAAWSPDEKLLLTGDLRLENLILWNAEIGAYLRTLPVGEFLSCTAFSHDGRFILVGTVEGNVYRIDAGDGNVVQTYNGLRGQVRQIDLSSDNRFLLGYTMISPINNQYPKMILWDYESGTVLNSFQGNGAFNPNGIDFSPTTNSLVTTDEDEFVRLWSLEEFLSTSHTKAFERYR